MTAYYGKLSLQELRIELKQRNARTSGRKAELVERLEAYDRNKNFGKVETMQLEFEMELPPLSSYKDLNNDITILPVGLSDVETFLSTMDKTLDKKATNLYENRFVNFVRVCHLGDRNKTFVRAEVRAEMKLNVTYKVDVCISAHCAIAEAQCECAAGMGPSAHCKHVCCVLFGLSEFTRTKTFKTVEICTQRLQTFYQSRKHNGSPIKAKNLKLHSNNLTSVDFDPRPETMREQKSFSSFFFNTIQNFGVFQNAPIMQFIPPANPYGIVNDHDYCTGHPEEIFLKQEGLQDLTSTVRQAVQVATATNKIMWKEERRKIICSSDFGRLCKLERADKKKVCQGLMANQNLTTKAIKHGRKYESAAVKKYEELTGTTTSECGLFVCEQYPFLASTPDRIVCCDCLLKVKCPYAAEGKTISSETIPYLTEINGKLMLKKTHDYYYQVQGQLLCVGKEVKKVHFVVFTLADIKVIEIERDEQFIADMLAKLVDFHENYHKIAVLEKFLYRDYAEHFC